MPSKKQRETSDAPLQTILMGAEVYEQIRVSVGTQKAEHGGMLGGLQGQPMITQFRYDDGSQQSPVTYAPGHLALNQLLEKEWNPADIRLQGFVHSHPPGFRHPSAGDLTYAHSILAANPDLAFLFLPIVMTEPDTGKFELLPFVVYREGKGVRCERAKLELLPPAETQHLDSPATQPELSQESTPSAIFERVQTAYDLERLQQSHLMCVGTGGAASFIEDMARVGVGRITLIDPDIVSVTNIATQQVYLRDVGRPKVEVLAERIREINPQALVTVRQQDVNEITDAEFEQLCKSLDSANARGSVLLCGCTDRFKAQARINRLGLQLGLPTLCAQVYQEGRAAEITFTYPGITPACQRCLQGSRYEHYLQKGFKNNVTSHGTPIFTTTRLNAAKGFLALAILHHGTAHPRWGTLLARIGNRNLIQLRLDPDLATSLHLSVFDRVFGQADQARLLYDEAVWLPQLPDCPANGFPTCPECHGTGDLRDSIGTFTDTRNMPL